MQKPPSPESNAAFTSDPLKNIFHDESGVGGWLLFLKMHIYFVCFYLAYPQNL